MYYFTVICRQPVNFIALPTAQTTPTRLPNPFGRGNGDLSSKLLSPKEKRWPCHVVKYHNKSAAEIGKKYSLNRKSITKWVASITKNGTIPENRGRQRMFLSADLQFFRSVCQST